MTLCALLRFVLAIESIVSDCLYVLHVFIVFCSLRFVYIDFDGNEVLHKDAAAVTVDGTLFV